MRTGHPLYGQGHLGVRVPDLVALVQDDVVPGEVGDGVYERGDSLVGENQHSTTAVDISHQLGLGATVRAGGVKDGHPERWPPVVELCDPLVEECGGG